MRVRRARGLDYEQLGVARVELRQLLQDLEAGAGETASCRLPLLPAAMPP
jgi:hypothetical protein